MIYHITPEGLKQLSGQTMAQLFVDDLTVMDFSFLDRQRGVVGDSWIVDVELAGGYWQVNRLISVESAYEHI